MDALASAPPPRQVAKSVQSRSLNNQRFCINAEEERPAYVAPPVSRPGFRVGGGLANRKTEFGKARTANGAPDEVNTVSRHEVVEKDSEHLLWSKVSERVIAYSATAGDGLPIESESDKRLAKFNLAKLADLETGNNDKSGARVFPNRSTVALPLDCNKVEEKLTRSNESDVGSSTLSGAEAYGERKENIVSGLQEDLKDDLVNRNKLCTVKTS